uniref:Uncharacterized protein n=1 Tax=Tetradesmus obliquus TaxID=3088 RepID=A0A383WNF9_TETOB|eukprot:jgi/Sobl393_1/17332/SZX78742.1
MRRVEEVRQAATTEQKQQLTMNLARKAKSAPKEMGKEFSDSYLPLWAFKHSFVCSGRQPTSDEGDRNEALLGFRNASQFLKAMEKALGISKTQLMRNLDAACYYCFELNLPQEKRLGTGGCRNVVSGAESRGA